jgi:hypothetical protein
MLRVPSRPPELHPRHAPPRPRWWATFPWRRPPRALLIAGAAALVVVVVILLAFGPIVRAKVAREADRRNLEVEVGRVRPGFFAVTLRDVRVKPRNPLGIEVRLDELRVDLGATLSVQEVKARGGVITLEGEPEELANRLRDLRASGDPAKPGSTSSAKVSASAEAVRLVWKLPSGGELTGSGIRLARDARGIHVGCETCAASHRHLRLEVANGEAELALDGAPRRLTANTVGLVYEPPRALPAPPPTAALADPTPPPLPSSIKRGAKRPGAAPLPSGGAEVEPALPLPNLEALRARIATAVAVVAPRIPDGGNVDIGGLTAKLDIGGEPVTIGPGAFTLSRHGDRLRLGFASVENTEARKTSTTDGHTPLSLDADLPIGPGDMVLRLAGGPVSLAVLGVKEGTKGLTDVAHGTVSGKGQLVLSAAADALTFDGEVGLRGIAMKEPRISPEPLRGIDFSVSARGVLDAAGHLRVDDAELDMGALHVKTHGTIEETPDHFAVALSLAVAPAACQALLDSSPQGLLPTVRPARMGGTFDASVNLAFDTRTIDKLTLDYKIGDQCRMLEVPRDLSREHFAGSFTYRTYHPDGSIGETTTGPGTASWTDLDDISPFMIAAVLTTEDGAFYKHHGFNHAAIRSSVQANLKARRFVRGASTITMQLAKNLFLARDKALSRKIEEVILTDYLEQILRKDDMMELYLNVVEFGPDVYGITHAAEHYFGRKPEELNLAECFFLASLLPSPIRYGKLREKGEVSETWMRHLRALMEIAGRNGKVSRAELEEGLKQPVGFVRPGDPRPEPRKAVTATRRDPYEDDAAWRVVD